MTKVAESIVDLLSSFEVKRANEIDIKVLKSMTAPIVDGEEQRQIIKTFTSKDYLEDDKTGRLASFVILSPEELPLVFFSLRCGELFESTSMNKMRIGHDAYIALQEWTNGELTTKEEQDEALSKIRCAISEGLTIDDFESFDDKHKAWEYDDIIDSKKEINKVFKVYPAIELKLFGINESAKAYWKSLGLPNDKKMGECLFWTKVVEVICKVQKIVGCQYLFLFAADKDVEGQLVQYYRVRLGFDYNAKMTANKPRFDWDCQFLFQDIESLLKGRDRFISSFTKEKIVYKQ